MTFYDKKIISGAKNIHVFVVVKTSLKLVSSKNKIDVSYSPVLPY
jgi:hypothetical protein